MSSEIPVKRREGGVPWWVLALIAAIAIIAALYLFGVFDTLGSPASGGGVQMSAQPTDPAASG